MYIAPGRAWTRPPSESEDAFYHSPSWPRNEQGSRHLIKLSTLAFLEGYYYKPRVDKKNSSPNTVTAFIALSGCLKRGAGPGALPGGQRCPGVENCGDLPGFLRPKKN